MIECTCVGQNLKPAGQNWYAPVIAQKLVNGKLLVYFANGFICDNKTCRCAVIMGGGDAKVE